METQGAFVQSLAAEVRASSFNDVEDLVSFVQWLNEELFCLVCLTNIFVLHEPVGLDALYIFYVVGL